MKRLLAIGAALAAPIAFSSSPALAAGPAVESLSHPGSLSRYAFIEYGVVARERPSRTAKPVGRLTTTSYWGTSTLVPALKRIEEGHGGKSWTQVRLPLPPPNRLIGWVPTEALSSLHSVNTWLQIDRERFTATLIRNRHVVFRAPIGVGQLQWPTPAGEFIVEERLTPTETDSVYGVLAFGTSAHSQVLTEWPNQGQIGIHGTNEPWLIPGNISHGCIRLRNEDILRLDRLMPVGTPITIR